MAIKAVIHTNQSSIDRVLGAGLPVVLAFWSPQSTQDDPGVLEDLAVDFAGRALIAKVNAADEAALMTRFNVTQLPSFVFVKDGRAEATVAGPLSQETLRAWLRHLSEGGPRPETAATDRTHKRNGQNGHANPRAQQTSAKPVQLTDATFEQAINGDLPVLVDFWAEWCGPCRMVGPSVEQLAQEFAGRAVVAKLNIDQNPRVPQRFGIMSIPTLYIFKNGQVVDKIVGAQPLPALRKWLARHVSG